MHMASSKIHRLGWLAEITTHAPTQAGTTLGLSDKLTRRAAGPSTPLTVAALMLPPLLLLLLLLPA